MRFSAAGVRLHSLPPLAVRQHISDLADGFAGGLAYFIKNQKIVIVKVGGVFQGIVRGTPLPDALKC